MSGTDHSFGCKCGNCKGLIEAGNLVPLFIPNHEEIKMRKLRSETNSKVVLEPSGQHLVVKDMTIDPSLVIDISTTSSRSNTLSSGETPVGRNVWMSGGAFDNSYNIYTIPTGTPVQKFSTAYKYGVNYDTDGSYISALYWLSQASTGSVSSRVSNYLSPIAYHEGPWPDDQGPGVVPDPGDGGGPGDPGGGDADPGGGGAASKSLIYLSISVNQVNSTFPPSNSTNVIAIPTTTDSDTSTYGVPLTLPAISEDSSGNAVHTIYVSFYTQNNVTDWYDIPTITYGASTINTSDANDRCKIVDADGNVYSDQTIAWGEAGSSESGTLDSGSNTATYQKVWKNSLRLKLMDQNLGTYTFENTNGTFSNIGYQISAPIAGETQAPIMQIVVRDDKSGVEIQNGGIWQQTAEQQEDQSYEYSEPVIEFTSIGSTSDPSAIDFTPRYGDTNLPSEQDYFNYGATFGSNTCPYRITYTQESGTPSAVSLSQAFTETNTGPNNYYAYQWSVPISLSATQFPDNDRVYTISVDASDLWTDIAGNKNVASSFTFTAKSFSLAGPEMTIECVGGITGNTITGGVSPPETGAASDTYYNVKFTSNQATTDFVPVDVALTSGSFSQSSFAVSGDNTIFDISFVPANSSGNVDCTISVEANTFTNSSGYPNGQTSTGAQGNEAGAPSLTWTQPLYIPATGSPTDPSLLPSYLIGDTSNPPTSQRGSIPGDGSSTTDPSYAYYKIDVLAGFYYTIETSAPNPGTTDGTYDLTSLQLALWDSTFNTQVSYDPDPDLPAPTYPANYSANVFNSDGILKSPPTMNYPVSRHKIDVTPGIQYDPSSVQANGSIYLTVNDLGFDDIGFFNIVVKRVALPDLPSLEVLSLNTITEGQIIYDSVREIAYDVWQISLAAGYQYEFSTYQFGAPADVSMSLWSTEEKARNQTGGRDGGGSSSFLYPEDRALIFGDTYYLRVQENGENADASYNVLVTMTNTNLTPYYDYNANTYASTQTDVSRCLLYGFGGPDSGTYTSSSLSPYFTSNGIPRAFTGILSETGTLSSFTANEIEGIKDAIYAWTEPMGMPSQELLDSNGGRSVPDGWNGTLDVSANFKIYVVEASQLDSTYSGLEGLCYPPGYFGSNGQGQTILMEGYMLFVRSSGLYWSDSLKPGGYGYNVILHELGHGFGFAHPFDTGGGGSGVFPGVSAAQAGLPDQFQPYILGDNSYNQIIVTSMAYSSSLQYTGFNYYVGPSVGSPGYSEMLGTPTPLDVTTLTSLYDYRRDASGMFIGAGGATYWLDASNRSGLVSDQSTNVFGWTTISIRLPPNGTTSQTENDGKLYIDAYSNNDASNDVVIDLRRTQVQMYNNTNSLYEGLSDPSLLCLSYLIPPGMIKENNDEPYVDFDAMAGSGVGASNAGKGGCMISEFCSAPGGISAYGSNVPGSSCMIYSNLGVATSSQDNASPNAAAGAFVGPGPGVLGRSKINGGKVVSGDGADSVRTASVIYSKLDPSFVNAYSGDPVTEWQNTYYFEIDDSNNFIKVYLGRGADYQVRYDNSLIDNGQGKLQGYEEYYDQIVTNTISQFVFNNYNGTTSVIPTDVVCLAEGTEVMVWKPDTKKSFYKKIENITAADYVVTYGNGPKKVLGVMESYNFPVRVDNWHKKKVGTLTKNMAMYRLDPEDYPELKKELYLTGGHSLLKTKMSNHERTEMNKIDWPRKFRQIDGLWKVLTHVSENANPVYKVCKVYNMVLDQDDKTDMFKNYAIYANGMLVETCNIQHLHRAKKLNQMMKYDTNLKKSMTCRK